MPANNMKTKGFRRMTGKVNALRNDARKGAIPPDSWEDKGPSKLNQAMRYAFRLFGIRRWNEVIKTRLPFNVFFAKFRDKFPTYKECEVKDMYYTILKFSKDEN